MGRFYRTTDPQRVDFMYQLPENLMMKVVENADAQNDKALETAALYNNALKINYNPQDKEAALQWASGWNKQIDDITSDITKNPANWRKSISKVKDLGRQLNQDLTIGDAAKIVSNYNLRENFKKEADKGVELYMKDSTQGTSPMIKKSQLDYYDKKYSGFKNKDGSYNQYNAEAPVKTYDAVKDLTAKLKELKPDGQKWEQDDIGNWYITSKSGSKEYISPQKVAQTALNSIMSDPTAMEYYKSGNKYGFVNGSLEGSPFVTDDTGNLTGFNYNHALANPLAAVSGIFSFSKAEEKQQYKGANPVSMENLSSANSLRNQQAGISLRDSLEDVNSGRVFQGQDGKWYQRNNLDIDDIKKGKENAEWQRRHDLGRGEQLKDYDKKLWDGINKARISHGLPPVNRGSIAVGSNGMAQVMPPIVSQMASVKAPTRTYLDDQVAFQGLKIQREMAIKAGNTDQLAAINAQLYNKQQAINTSRTLANQELLKAGYTQEDIDRYNYYASHKSEFDAYVKNTKEKGPSLVQGEDGSYTVNAVSAIPKAFYAPSMNKENDGRGIEIKGASGVVDFYNKMGNIVSKTQDEYYNTISNRDVRVSGISLQGQQGESLKNQIYTIASNNPSSVNLIDPTNPSGGVKMAISKDFRNQFDITDVGSFNGTAFKVVNRNTGKEYIMQMQGNNNIDHIVYDTYKNAKGVPGADRVLAEIGNTMSSSLKYEMNYIQPGESKVVNLNSDVNLMITRSKKTGGYNAFENVNGAWVPLGVRNPTNPKKGVDLINFSQEAAADAIAERVYGGN